MVSERALELGFFFPLSAHLDEQLESYMSNYPKVKIVREKERVGLIRARLSGARHARGEVLTYLDSHCECSTGPYTGTRAAPLLNSAHLIVSRLTHCATPRLVGTTVRSNSTRSDDRRLSRHRCN